MWIFGIFKVLYWHIGAQKKQSLHINWFIGKTKNYVSQHVSPWMWHCTIWNGIPKASLWFDDTAGKMETTMLSCWLFWKSVNLQPISGQLFKWTGCWFHGEKVTWCARLQALACKPAARAQCYCPGTKKWINWDEMPVLEQMYSPVFIHQLKELL